MGRSDSELKKIIDSSLAVRAVRACLFSRKNFSSQIRGAFACSVTYKVVSLIWLSIKAAFHYSGLSWLTEVRDGPPRDLLGGSLTFAWLRNKAGKSSSKFGQASGESFFAKNIFASFGGIGSNPVKAVGVFLLLSGSANSLLSIALGPEMGLVGVLLRVAWIGFGLLCIVCPSGCRPSARDSLLLRLIARFG